jgi:colanic acid biosynthesis glycosyl transferase WcaI
VVAKTDPPLISVVAAVVVQLRGAGLVNWCQDLFPEIARSLGVRGAGGPFGWLLQALRNWSLNSANANVVLGDEMAQRLRAEGVRANAIQVIHNWADGSSIRPCSDEAGDELREAWGLKGKFVVAYSGNMGRAHEFGTILDTAAALKDTHEIAFLFVGGGSRQAWMVTEGKRRRLENVSFQPYQPRERLADSLCVADAHLVSLHPELEGLVVPSKFYGIAAAGLPTLYVGDPDGEIGRLVREARCGFAVRPGQSGLLAEHIRELAADPRRVSEMGANARTLFEGCFDKPIAMAKWRAALEGAVRDSVEGLVKDG